MDDNKLQVTIEWENDNYPNLDNYGKFVNRMSGCKTTYVDRQHKILVDPKKEIIVEFYNEDAYDDYVNTLEHYGVHFIDDYLYNDEDEIVKWYINHDYFEKLNGYKSDYDRHQSEYIVSTNFPNANNREEYDYIIQDAQLLEDYYMGKWESEVLTVRISLLNVELASCVTAGYDKMTEEDKRIEEKSVVEMVKQEAIDKLLELQSIPVMVKIVVDKE